MEVRGTVPEVINCHACGAVLDLAGQTAFTHVDCARCGAISVVPMQFGNFLLLNPLGIGGMGTVYKAVDLSLNRQLALKILRPKLAAKPEFIENFAREARAAATVSHPNIAQVYSFGEFEGQYYLAMELLERGSLDDRMSTLGKLAEKDILEIGYQIASGLRAAEQRGLLHRDVKPGNILFNDDGIPKIVDFGLARAQVQNEPATAGGEPIWGTPYYIAPEKLRGQPEDLRSDIYSLGATLYHALAGRPPFDAATAGEVITKHATQPAYSLKTYAPAIHSRTAHVIGRMLSKNPAERYATYDELLHDIHETQEQLHGEAQQKVVVASTGEKIPLVSVIITVVAVSVALIAVIVVWWKLFKKPALDDRPAATVVGTTTGATTNAAGAVIPAVDEVNFNEDADWVRSWNTGMLQLAQGNFDKAFLAFGQARQQVGPQRPRHRRWIAYYEGMTLLAADRPQDAQRSFLRALSQTGPCAVSEPVAAHSFIDPLACVMTGRLPPAQLEQALPRLPAWAQALGYVALGFRHLHGGELEPALENFRRYQQLPATGDQRWVYHLQPLTDKLTRRCDQVRLQLAQITELERQGKLDEALAALAETRAAQPPAMLRPVLDQQASRLQAAVQARDAAAAAAQAEEERRQAAAAEAERQRVAEDVRALQAVEPELQPLWAAYDFRAAAARYEAFQQTVTTAGGKAAVQQRIDAARLLAELKTKLLADFPRRPVPGAQLTTRTGARPIGNLVRGTETQLVFANPYGEELRTWRDFAPAELVKLAAFHLAGEKPQPAARRCVQLAVLGREFGLEQVAPAYAAQAVKLDPAQREQLVALGFTL